MVQEESDDELMVRIADQDEEAFRSLMERHQDRVFGTVARMMGGAGPEPEEVAQDIFLRVWKSAPKYRPEGKFITWLMTVVRNLVFTRTGQRRRRKVIDGPEPVDPETGASLLDQHPDDSTHSPQSHLIHQELARAVEKACAELPEKQRWVFHLRQYEGLEYEEIARISGQSLTGVKALMFRARETLKKKLSGYLTASD